MTNKEQLKEKKKESAVLEKLTNQVEWFRNEVDRLREELEDCRNKIKTK